MSWAILEAQEATGIGLTHLPVLYTSGGFGGAPAEPGQRRFLHTVDGFAALLERLRPAFRGRRDRRLGIAPHSLRAVPDSDLDAALAVRGELDGSAPVHIHVAEQVREVRDCLAWCGRRPLQHLLDHAPVDGHWCVIHATHLDDREIDGLARTGAVAGLCPTTEANLGDGLFALPAFLDGGGRIAIGSDSHVSVSPLEELRWLEYGQRLQQLRRLVAADHEQPHCGCRLVELVLAGGARALGRPLGRIEPGCRADLVRLDTDHPLLVGRADALLLDALVFSGNASPIRDVMVGGAWRVRDGRHHARDEVVAAFRTTMRRILEAL